MSPPPIDELVGLLNRNAPNILKQLRTEFPQSNKLLEPGNIMGEAADETGVRLSVALAGLTTATELCKEGIRRIRKRLRAADRTQFCGQLVTIVAGASIFGVLEVDVPKGAKYLAASLALLGSVLTFVAQYLVRGFGGKGINLYDTYSELVDAQIESDGILAELEVRKQTAQFEEVSALIAEANALSAKVKRLESLDIG
jgi:hypothetical protein